MPGSIEKKKRVQTVFSPRMYKMLETMERVTGLDQSEILRHAFLEWVTPKMELLEHFEKL